MRSAAFNHALVNQPNSKRAGNKIRTGFEISIMLAAASGLIFSLLGFLLLAVFTFFERTKSALNYAGVGSLICAFIFFAFSAHFMDKSEETKSLRERAEFEMLSRK